MAAITEENFGRYLFLYRTEAVPKNISMQRFCMRNGIKYDEFFLWYKKTQQKIEPVVVVGEPEPACQEPVDQECTTTSEPETYYSICITTSQGLKLSQEGLSYQKLKSLVEKLEVLC